MKLCINCQHFYVPEHHTPSAALCKAVEPEISPVTGETYYPKQFCSAARVTPCGKDAVLFTPKETTHE